MVRKPFREQRSANGADTRRDSREGTRGSLRGALERAQADWLAVVRDSLKEAATVLRGFLSSAKVADARRPTAEELANPLGGVLDPVLRGVPE